MERKRPCERCGKRCIEHSNALRRFCMECAMRNDAESQQRGIDRYSHARKRAYYEVGRARLKGELPTRRQMLQDGTKCVDCGEQAYCLDHRDYRKALEVEPVCFSCNTLRGSGKNAWI